MQKYTKIISQFILEILKARLIKHYKQMGALQTVRMRVLSLPLRGIYYVVNSNIQKIRFFLYFMVANSGCRQDQETGKTPKTLFSAGNFVILLQNLVFLYFVFLSRILRHFGIEIFNTCCESLKNITLIKTYHLSLWEESWEWVWHM